VPISKQEQIQQRRVRVWQLYSQGLTQEEIAKELQPFHVTRRTVGYDLEWLREDALNFVIDNRKHIAEEYKKVMSNLEQLRAEAWKQFRKIENKDSSVKVALYDTIQSVNNNILVLLSVGDAIEMELKIKAANKNTKEIREEMDKLIEQNSTKRQAKF
jgi:orotate phosphoribosyltransferase-like protein